MRLTRRSRTTVLLLAALICATAGLVTGPPALAAPSSYPPVLPDFSHSESPHYPDYGPRTGLTHRPMLVVYVTYDDAPAPAGKDAAWARQLFFGPTGRSVSGYFADASGGASTFFPASETEGTPDDGVVVLNMGRRSDNEVHREPGMSNSEYVDAILRSEALRNGLVLQAADRYVDFGRYDRDRDGRLDATEIAVEKIDTWPSLSHLGDGQSFCGATRGVTLSDPLDGVRVDGLDVAAGGTKQNRLTWAHETMHAAYGMVRDWYGWPEFYGFDVASATCSATREFDWTVSSWHRMHLGWLKPHVVTRDGYYAVPRLDTGRTAFLLYDPQKGPDDYLLVENRRAGGEGYDRGVGFGRSGLAVWRYDEKQYHAESGVGSPLKLTHPCEGDSCPSGWEFELWDPSDARFPGRTVAIPWADGSPSRVAVRAVYETSDAQLAYFDVPGPGALVDCFSADAFTSYRVTAATAPTREGEVTVTVRNTGEVVDTFEVAGAGLPSGWSTTRATVTLPPGVDTPVTLRVRPAADAPEGATRVGIGIRSTTDSTVGSRCEVRVVVRRVLPSIAVSAPDRLVLDPLGARVTVTDPASGAPVAGAPVRFTVLDHARRTVLVDAATTDGTGSASADVALRVPAGAYQVRAEVEAHGAYSSRSLTTALTVSRRPVEVDWAGATTGQYTDPAGLAARVLDAATGAPVRALHVSLGVGAQRVDARSDAAGVAQAPLQLAQPAGEYVASASVSGDDVYAPAHVSLPYTVTREGVTVLPTGPTSGSTGSGLLLEAAAQQSPDGYELPLDGTLVRFDLAGLLGSTSAATAPVDAAGNAVTTLTDVPSDLYELVTAVDPTSPYWQGRAKPVEVVVSDTERRLAGGGKALDDSGRPFSVQASVGHDAAGSVVGRLSARGAFGSFRGDSPQWLAAIEDRAVAQVHGTWDGAPATARLRVLADAAREVELVLTRADRHWSSGGLVPLSGEFSVS